MHETRCELRDRLLGVLHYAMRERERRRDFVPGPDGYPECRWAAYERSQMHGAVNGIRVSRGLAPVTLDAVLAVEGQAVWHVDYDSKFAIGCADLVLDGWPGEEVPVPPA